MAAKKAPAKKSVSNTGSANAAEKRVIDTKKKNSNRSRVTSKIPSVYEDASPSRPGVSLSKVSGSRGIRTEPTQIVRNGPFERSALVTKVKSGAPATANMAKPGKSTAKKKKSQAGDLGSERATMRKVQQYNDKARKGYEKYGFGTVAVTYRDKSGKLKATTVNRQRKK